MRVLGLDTSTPLASIALLDDTRVIASATHDTSGRRSSDLLIAIDRMFAEAGATPAQLDAVAIGGGPGSFTGLRIGMATAKGIAFAAQRPLWAVSSLAALAHEARAALAHDAKRSPIVAVLDARRGEVFAGCYRDGALIGEERVFSPGQLATWADEMLGAGATPPAEATFVGDALAAYPDALSPLAERWITLTPTGVAVAQLALAGPRADVLTSGAPTYIRASEAEIMYPDGIPGALRRDRS
jgi:tRNA threonylcarbamoyladenosine biosynthesis protein TsaB